MSEGKRKDSIKRYATGKKLVFGNSLPLPNRFIGQFFKITFMVVMSLGKNRKVPLKILMKSFGGQVH